MTGVSCAMGHFGVHGPAVSSGPRSATALRQKERSGRLVQGCDAMGRASSELPDGGTWVGREDGGDVPRVRCGDEAVVVDVDPAHP